MNRSERSKKSLGAAFEPGCFNFLPPFRQPAHPPTHPPKVRFDFTASAAIQQLLRAWEFPWCAKKPSWVVQDIHRPAPSGGWQKRFFPPRARCWDRAAGWKGYFAQIPKCKQQRPPTRARPRAVSFAAAMWSYPLPHAATALSSSTETFWCAIQFPSGQTCLSSTPCKNYKEYWLIKVNGYFRAE